MCSGGGIKQQTSLSTAICTMSTHATICYSQSPSSRWCKWNNNNNNKNCITICEGRSCDSNYNTNNSTNSCGYKFVKEEDTYWMTNIVTNINTNIKSVSICLCLIPINRTLLYYSFILPCPLLLNFNCHYHVVVPSSSFSPVSLSSS